MNKRFEYVASGTTYLRINMQTFLSSPDTIERFNRGLSQMSSNLHNFSMLYNAHTEKKLGNVFKQNHKGLIDKIYADSGGLQVVTQGMEITPEFKREVYRNQATYADLGMSFDEIPVSMLDGKSERNDFGSRYFDNDKFEWAARESGRNFNEQVKVYREMGSTCKPVFIIQGNSLEKYKRWIDYAFDEIDNENYECMGGIATSSASLGIGALEDVKRAYWYHEISDMIPTKQVHLLGVGSVARLIPNMIFMNSGLYDKDVLISYDSTSHTSAWCFGKYYTDQQKMVYFPKDFADEIYEYVYNDIMSMWGSDIFNIDLQTFRENINANMSTETCSISSLVAKQFLTLSSIKNFMGEVEEGFNDIDKVLQRYFTNREIPLYNNLKSIRDLKDYTEWELYSRRHIKSSPINENKPQTLNDFF